MAVVSQFEKRKSLFAVIFPSLKRRGGRAINKMDPFRHGAAGVVSSVASQLLIDAAASPPFQGGESLHSSRIQTETLSMACCAMSNVLVSLVKQPNDPIIWNDRGGTRILSLSESLPPGSSETGSCVPVGDHFGLGRFRVRSGPAKRKRIDDLMSSTAPAEPRRLLQRRVAEGCCPLEHTRGSLPALAS
jgi:hypothetical protein